MKFHEWGMDVDPDESCWVESVKFNVSFLVVIRVFFELGFSACEEIGRFVFVFTRSVTLDDFMMHIITAAIENVFCFISIIRWKANSAFQPSGVGK